MTAPFCILFDGISNFFSKLLLQGELSPSNSSKGILSSSFKDLSLIEEDEFEEEEFDDDELEEEEFEEEDSEHEEPICLLIIVI